MYISHIHFCAISFIRTQGLHFPKNFGKIVTTNPNINLCLDNTKCKNSLNSVDQFMSYTCYKIFVTHTQTDTQTNIFQKYSNRVQDIPKRVDPSKIENRKICSKPILSSIQIEEIKKRIMGIALHTDAEQLKHNYRETKLNSVKKIQTSISVKKLVYCIQALADKKNCKFSTVLFFQDLLN